MLLNQPWKLISWFDVATSCSFQTDLAFMGCRGNYWELIDPEGLLCTHGLADRHAPIHTDPAIRAADSTILPSRWTWHPLSLVATTLITINLNNLRRCSLFLIPKSNQWMNEHDTHLKSSWFTGMNLNQSSLTSKIDNSLKQQLLPLRNKALKI